MTQFLLFLAAKVGRAALTVLMLVTIAFVVLRTSGDPAVMLLGIDVPASAVEALRARWGLDEPILEQYLAYLRNLASGDFGVSFVGNRPALEVVAERLPETLALMGLAALVAVVLGTALGVAAALNRNTWIDRATVVVATAGFSVPNFVVGVALIVVFGATLRLLPTWGAGSPLHYILPVLTLATADMALFARFSRSAMLEVLALPHVRTALAKGLAWRGVLLGHVLRNASIVLVTVLGFYLGRMIGGAVVTENVFAWPGIGSLLVLSVENRDFAVIQTILLLVGCTMVTANLLVEVAYRWLDPRMVSTAGARP